MDYWNSFESLNFRDLVWNILFDNVRDDSSHGSIVLNDDDISIVCPVLDEDSLEEEIDTLIVHNNDGTSTMRLVFDENLLKGIDVCGSGHLYLYQERDCDQGWIEITTPTEDIQRFKLNYGSNTEKIIVSPKDSGDAKKYTCCVYVKQRIPELSLNNHVTARLATNITSDYLSFKLQEQSCLLETDNRIKVLLLRISAWGNAQIMKLQGVATRQELFLCDKTQYTSALKSNEVNIYAYQKSKAHIYFEKNMRKPDVIKGSLNNVSELRYSGNPVVKDVRCSNSSLLKSIGK